MLRLKSSHFSKRGRWLHDYFCLYLSVSHSRVTIFLYPSLHLIVVQLFCLYISTSHNRMTNFTSISLNLITASLFFYLGQTLPCHFVKRGSALVCIFGFCLFHIFLRFLKVCMCNKTIVGENTKDWIENRSQQIIQPHHTHIWWCKIINERDKQRVLMHGHQGWNVRHGLCHIYMIYVYIWVVYSFCLFCCLFIIVTTQFVALYKPCKPKPKPSTYDPPPPRTTTPWQRSKDRYLDRSQSNKYAINMQIQTISVSK